MKSFTLELHNRAQLSALMTEDAWVVACLCAAWCGSCREYRNTFETLAQRHPEKEFIWIDIEDQADVVGDIDVENFPALLIQRGDLVTFFGTVTPDPGVADRLIKAQASQDAAQLQADARSSVERTQWQEKNNLRKLLRKLAATPG